MSEFSLSRVIFPTAVLALGAISCGGQSNSKPQTTPDKPTNPVTIKDHYYPNGTKEIDPVDDGDYYTTILQFCEGPNLITQTRFDANSGNSIAVTPNFAGCADGKLTPSDFKLPMR